MKKLSLLIFACCLSLSIGAHGWPANYGGVMLQGFSWDSFIDTQWTNLEAQSDELAEYFDLIWVPQSGNCNSSYNVMGYTPVYWYDHNSSFGTEAQLRSFIKTCKEKGVGVIADVVINHRGSLGVNGSWVDFPAETYQGKTWQLGLADICIDDDGGATAKKYAVSGAKDTGEDWSGMRDLDHTSANVQANVINYLNFLKDDLGYVGFRYDMTKGYAAKYTGLYNATVKPTYSVGEYWDGSVNLLMTWIAGTKVDDEIQSATFDFATRYVLRDACAAANWSKLATKGLAAYDNYKRYAVTFVENHDTQYRSAQEPGDPINNFISVANAYILSTPGVPCIFLPHWKSNKALIKQLILARKMAGIHSQSTMQQLSSSSSLHVVEVTGSTSKLLFRAGSSSYALPEGYVEVVSDNQLGVALSKDCEQPWLTLPSGSYETAQEVTLLALSRSSDAQLVYTLDGSEPTASSSKVSSGSKLTIDGATTLKVGLLKQGVVSAITTRHYQIVPFQPHQVTVYVKAPGWTNVYFYAWANDGKNTQLNGAWPGKAVTDTKMIDNEKWYFKSFEVTADSRSFNIIFNKGSNADQTVDIGPVSEDAYFVVSADKTNGKFTVEDVTAATSILSPTTTSSSVARPFTVHALNGQLLRTLPANVPPSALLNGLPHGIYIVNGKKMVR